jgi:DNA-binding MarR family transcriptional regulator
MQLIKMMKLPLDLLAEVFDILEATHVGMTVIHFHILMILSEKSKMSLMQISTILGLHKRLVARSIDVLSIHGNGRTPGLGLVDIERDPTDLRRRTYELTSVGASLQNRILQILGAYES